MSGDVVWRLLFTAATAGLMLGLLLSCAQPLAGWVYVVYPGIGGAMAYAASRTSPSVEEIARIETSTIAAACVAVPFLFFDSALEISLFGGPLVDSTLRVAAVIAVLLILLGLSLPLERRLSGLRARMTDAQR